MNADPDLLTHLLESHRGMVDRILSIYERSESAREDLHRDVAVALGIGEGAVTVRLHRARQTLSLWMHRT